MNVREEILSEWGIIKSKFLTLKDDLTKSRLANQKVVEKLTKQNLISEDLQTKQKIISELRKDHQKVLENFNKLQVENMSLNEIAKGTKLDELSKIKLRTKVRELITTLETNDDEEEKKHRKQALERFINFEL